MITHFMGIQEAAIRSEIAAEAERVDLEAELRELQLIADCVQVVMREDRGRELGRVARTIHGPRWRPTDEEARQFRTLKRIAKAVDRRRLAIRRQLEQPSLRLVYDNAEQLKVI